VKQLVLKSRAMRGTENARSLFFVTSCVIFRSCIFGRPGPRTRLPLRYRPSLIHVVKTRVVFFCTFLCRYARTHAPTATRIRTCTDAHTNHTSNDLWMAVVCWMGARFFILRLVAKSGINNSVLVGSHSTNDVYTEGQVNKYKYK